MSVTIWDTTADDGAGAIARVATPVYTPSEDPDGEGTTEITYGPPLARVTDSVWARPKWIGTPQQFEPWLVPDVQGFQPGWVILVDDIVTPETGADEQLGALGDTPEVDLEAGTATWTYAVVARSVAARKAAMRAAATARFREIVAAGKIIGGVTIDLTSEGFERLSQAHAALSAGSGPISAVTVRGGRIDLPDASTAATVIAAGRSYYLAAAATERVLYDAVDDVADDADPTEGHAALDLIDVEAGTVDGEGGWPS